MCNVPPVVVVFCGTLGLAFSSASAQEYLLATGSESRAAAEHAGPGLGVPMRIFHVERGDVPQRVTVSGGKVVAHGPRNGGAASEVDERLAYSNTLGRFVLTLPTYLGVFADDLTLDAAPGCMLRRFTFVVTGRANPTGVGGPYGVTYALYDDCPLAGGAIIAGTAGMVAFPDDAPRVVEVVVPAGVELPASTVWLGLRFNRRDCGTVLGAPSLTGYSADSFDWSPDGCSMHLGGWPDSPHGSLNAEVYVDSGCAEAFVGFDNPGLGADALGFGPDYLLSDDVELGVEGCALAGYQVRVSGSGSYEFFLWTGTVMPGSSDFTTIPGTERTFEVPEEGRHLLRAGFDPPIPVPRNFSVGFRAGNHEAEWVTAGGDPRIGRSPSRVRCHVLQGDPHPGGFSCFGPGGPPEPEGFDVSISCAGEAPVGACCDMFVTQCGGTAEGLPCDDNDDCPVGQTCESVCREVPEINCPLPPDDPNFRPGWVDGGSCDAQPFPRPCGQAACCTPQSECHDLTRNECYALEPLYKPREWQGGLYCGTTTQQCPHWACLNATGDCTEARDRLCNGGGNDGAICFSDPDCRGTCFLNVCQSGCRVSQPCTSSAQCNCDGLCDVTDPNNPHCVGGARDGEFCDPEHEDLECRESYCQTFPGCGDHDCCANVCIYNPGPPLFTEFCCEVEWDLQCAELAGDRSLGLCPGAAYCPAGKMAWLDPPDSVIDAGRPYRPGDVTALEGIQTFLLRAPSGADVDCWDMYESLQNTGLHPDYELGLLFNEVLEMVLQANGQYVMLLKRPITPGERTTICYSSGKFLYLCGSFVAHPGDVNADGTTDLLDVAVLIDVLLGKTEVPWGLYSTDIDRDGAATFLDLLELVDLLVGAGDYGVWWGSWIL